MENPSSWYQRTTGSSTLGISSFSHLILENRDVKEQAHVGHILSYIVAKNIQVLKILGFSRCRDISSGASSNKLLTLAPRASQVHSSRIPHLILEYPTVTPWASLVYLPQFVTNCQSDSSTAFGISHLNSRESIQAQIFPSQRQKLLLPWRVFPEVNCHPWLKKYTSQLDRPLHQPAMGPCWNFFGEKLKFFHTQSHSSFPQKRASFCCNRSLLSDFSGQVSSLWISRTGGAWLHPYWEEFGTNSLLPTLDYPAVTAAGRAIQTPKPGNPPSDPFFHPYPNPDCWKTSPKLNPLHLKFPQILGVMPFPCPRLELGHLREIFLHMWSQCCNYIIATNSVALIPEDMDGSFPKEMSTQSRFDKILNIWQEQQHT